MRSSKMSAPAGEGDGENKTNFVCKNKQQLFTFQRYYTATDVIQVFFVAVFTPEFQYNAMVLSTTLHLRYAVCANCELSHALTH